MDADERLLAADLGRSRCRAALWAGGIRTDAAGAGAPGLASPGGADAALAAVLAVVRPMVGRDGVAAVSVGAAGALTAPAEAALLAARLCTALPAARAVVGSDAVMAHAGALYGRPGVVLSVGTGAVALACGVDGALRRVDGAGPWLGDEGGGGWLGLRGLRAALRASEGRGPPTALQAAAIARFGPLAGLPARLEGGGDPQRLAAAFAPDVAAAAEAGDSVAAALLRRAVETLACTLRAAAAGLPRPVAAAVVGGLSGMVGPALHGSLAADGLTFAGPAGDALDGARLLLQPGSLWEAGLARAASGPPATSLDTLATEAARPGLDDLDRRSPGEIVHMLLAAERDAGAAMARAAPALAAAADAVALRMVAGGRLFTLGAGTPGRLAVLDAAELLPTYNAPPGLVVPLLAGGPDALVRSAEGAEDDPDAAAAALDAHGLGPGDAVVGIAASGRTPYVVGGLRHAQARGALAVAVVNNPNSPAAAAADLAVEILTGPEVVAGSTRMLAGTSQKVALNALSTAAMIALGRTYGPWMVDVRATNAKLRRRALRMVCTITGAGEDAAAAALAAAEGEVKPAIVALLAHVDAAEAARRLARSGGRVREALA
ncbi:MAG TPA: N-acetylmuramic acid 6-phosphate etherase [Acetobacteraceae bacterium]